MQESVRGRDFTRGWALSLAAIPPSPSLWECGNPRLMRVSKRRGRSRLGLSTVDPARHFHSELTDSAHFGEKRRSGTPKDQKRHFSKSRVECTFLQIVVQSQKKKRAESIDSARRLTICAPSRDYAAIAILRSDLKPVRTSSEKICGCSQAAK